MTLVLLQNAWSPVYAGMIWPRESWIEALLWCRSGQRIKQFLPIEDDDDIRKGEAYWVDNTTPVCGPTANSRVKPDMGHVVGMLTRLKPSLVIACGKQAQTCIDKIGTHGHIKALNAFGRYSKVFMPHNYVPKFSRVYMPHPAMRLLTNKCCEGVRSLVIAAQERQHDEAFHVKFDPFGNQASI